MKILGREIKIFSKEKKMRDVKLRKATISSAQGFFTNTKSSAIPTTELETAFRRDPLIFKGITKKAEDIFREGWSIENPFDGTFAPEDLRKKIEDFEKRINLKEKLKILAMNTFIYGDGYLELDDGEENPEKELRYGQLKNVWLVYPPAVRKVFDENGEIKLYEYNFAGKNVKLHPSRIINTKFYTYGEGNEGISVIEVAYNNLLSKMNSDIAVGHIIYKTGKPFPILKKNTLATEEEMDKAEEIIKNLNPETGLALDGDWEFELKNPSPINPHPFNENFYINLGAALRMPSLILIGVQKGTVTGSEVDLVDYYKDIKNLQEMHFSNVLIKIYEDLTGLIP
ncbi:MAG: DUF1073 domain-containing protein, partial [Candidatus Thermoplasmatota archaeon]